MNRFVKVIFVLFVGLLFTTGCSFTKSNSSTKNSGSISDISTDDMFTDRDLVQTIDTSDATVYTLESNKDIKITKEGVYLIRGDSNNSSIVVEADSSAKIQLVLDGVSITNSSVPCIYVKSADKVFVTTINENKLTVNGVFSEDGDTNTDAVIYSKDDLVLNGTGSLTINSTDNGITSKDKLKITGGTITIKCSADGLEANDDVAIADGTITIDTLKDGIHAEYDEDDSVGFVYIKDGTITINSGDDAIHATTYITIDGGVITLNGKECLEATVITINDGTITINASDDGINGSQKSKSLSVAVNINGGTTTINMGQGDTDGVDSNGGIYINGGTLNINAQSPFDYDGEAKYNGGTMIINGEETTTITNQFMGGPGGNPGGHGGRRR